MKSQAPRIRYTGGGTPGSSRNAHRRDATLRNSIDNPLVPSVSVDPAQLGPSSDSVPSDPTPPIFKHGDHRLKIQLSIHRILFILSCASTIVVKTLELIDVEEKWKAMFAAVEVVFSAIAVVFMFLNWGEQLVPPIDCMRWYFHIDYVPIMASFIKNVLFASLIFAGTVGGFKLSYIANERGRPFLLLSWVVLTIVVVSGLYGLWHLNTQKYTRNTIFVGLAVLILMPVVTPLVSPSFNWESWSLNLKSAGNI